jgi:hypothetical protein
LAEFRNIYESPLAINYTESGWNGGKERVLPDRIGRNIDLQTLRTVTDMARAEEWWEIYDSVLARLQDKTPNHE